MLTMVLAPMSSYMGVSSAAASYVTVSSAELKLMVMQCG